MAGHNALAMMEKHLAFSADRVAQLQEWGHVLDDVERRRASLTDRPKLRRTLAGYPDAQFKQIVDQLGPRSATTVLESRWTTAASAR